MVQELHIGDPIGVFIYRLRKLRDKSQGQYSSKAQIYTATNPTPKIKHYTYQENISKNKIHQQTTNRLTTTYPPKNPSQVHYLTPDCSPAYFLVK